MDLASLQNKKLLYDFAKEMYYDVRAPGYKSIRDRTLTKLFETSGLMLSILVIEQYFYHLMLTKYVID